MRHLISIFSNFILALMGVGLTSCVAKAEYGCPHADFEAKGIVTDEDGQPIPGIRVVLSADYPNPDIKGPTDTLWTGNDGSYRYVPLDYGSDYPYHESIRFEFADVDGEANGGEFTDVDVEVPVFQVKPGDGNWYDGAYEAGVDVTMFKK